MVEATPKPILWTDGSVYRNGQIDSDAYFAVVYDNGGMGKVLAHDSIGPATVNQAEYEGVLWALNYAQLMGIDYQIISDSQLVVNQVSLKWACNLPHLVLLRDKAISLLLQTNCELLWKPREVNLAGKFFENLQKGRK